MDEFRKTLLRLVVLATLAGVLSGVLLGMTLAGADCPRATLSRDERL